MMVYKKNITEGLKDLASKSFQQIAWFENDQGLCSSYSDDVCAVFEGTGLQEALRNNEIVFSKEADAALNQLDEMVEAIGYNRDERELINAPEMEAVPLMAARCLELIESSEGSESTVEIIG